MQGNHQHSESMTILKAVNYIDILNYYIPVS